MSDLEILVGGVGAYKVGRAEQHPDQDVAALFLREAKGSVSDCFDLAVNPDGATAMYSLSVDREVSSYGFAINTKKRVVEGRLRRGNIQCQIEDHSYELSYPSFPGNSGSPVMLSADPGMVLGLISCNRNIEYRKLSSKTQTEDEGVRVVASYSVAVALNPLADWLGRVHRSA